MISDWRECDAGVCLVSPAGKVKSKAFGIPRRTMRWSSMQKREKVWAAVAAMHEAAFQDELCHLKANRRQVDLNSVSGTCAGRTRAAHYCVCLC